MDKRLAIDCIRKRYEHEPCLSPEERERHIDVEIKRVMGEGTHGSVGSHVLQERVDTVAAGSNPASPTTETAPLNGGIRQIDEASALSREDSTSRESLPNSCERSLGDALASSATIAPDAVKTFGGVSPTTIITEPVAAENNKQRKR